MGKDLIVFIVPLKIYLKLKTSIILIRKELMGKRVDIAGNRYGKVLVLKYAYSVDYGSSVKAFWTCQCDCGTVFETNGSNLRKGIVNSCGCIIGNSRQMREGREEYFQKGITKRFITEGRKRIYIDKVNMEE
jgi:hypothetical protein